MGQEVQPIKTNFTAGEVSPRFFGRVDNQKYLNGAAILENFVPMPHGGIIARPGTRFVHEVKNSSKKVRLISFEFNTTIEQSYILELGEMYMRFYQNNGIVTESAKVITGATQANPVVVTAVGHGYATGDHVIISDVVGMTQLNGKTFAITVLTADTFRLNGINGTGFTAYSSGGSVRRIYEIVTPYLEADLFQIQFAQTADVMYLTHRGYAPRKLVRSTHTSWTLSTPAFTTTAGAPIFNVAGDYPGAVTFFEQRLMLAGTDNNPQTVYGSQSDDYENFSPGTGLPAEGLEYTLATDKVNRILWLASTKVMVIGTTGGELIMRANDFGDAVTPDNVRITGETTEGSTTLPPLRIGNSVLFLQRVRRKILEFLYNFEIDGFEANDITILSEHILRDTVTDICFQQEEHRLVWLAKLEGEAATLTYQRDQAVFAWARQKFGGTDVVIESVATTPGATQNQLWVSIKRTINGGTKRYVEYLTDFFYATDDVGLEDSIQMDSSLTYDGVPADEITGLEHLEGESVVILADGKVHTNETVVNGAITLDYEASIVTVGLSYIPKMRTLNFEGGNFRGTAQGKLARISDFELRFFQTVGGFVGHEDGDFEELRFNEDGDVMDTATELFTGDIHSTFTMGHTRKNHLQYEQRQPLPCTILAVMPNFVVDEK